MSDPLNADEVVEQIKSILSNRSGHFRRLSDETEWAIRILVELMNTSLQRKPEAGARFVVEYDHEDD